MKILLISSNIAMTPYPIYPLGVSMITAALTAAGHEVRQFDFLQQKNSMDALGQDIKRFGPELIGISVRNIDNVNLMNEQYYIEIVKNIVKKIREVSNVKVILGGAGFSLIPDYIANCGMARAFAYCMEPGVDVSAAAIARDVQEPITGAVADPVGEARRTRGILQHSLGNILQQLG